MDFSISVTYMSSSSRGICESCTARVIEIPLPSPPRKSNGLYLYSRSKMAGKIETITGHDLALAVYKQELFWLGKY